MPKKKPSLSLPRLREYLVMYALGSLLYTAIELIYRGRTHFSMVMTGGLCGMLLHRINRRLPRKPIVLRALIGCLTITGVEFSVGCLVNRILHLNVWDYRNQPFHLLGQICPLFSLCWFFLCFPAFFISRLVSNQLAPCLKGGFLFDLFPHLTERIHHGTNQKASKDQCQ